ncbi:MAG: radical SAM protein, partial [Acidobacteriota bacterium]|nr:radical SAM protein [Acidobacteriota bacterium]
MPQQAVRYLVLWLTTACNARCAYCYRGEISPKTPQTMPTAIIDAALALAARSGAPFHVQMAGGEPTLEPALIAYTGEKVRGSHLPATMAIQTNGTRIDRRLTDICKRYGIDVGISIDGPPSVHERTRGQSADAFQGLAHLAATDLPVRVTTVLTRENASHLDKLALALSGYKNVGGFGIDVLIDKGRAHGNAALIPDEAQVEAGTRELLEALMYINRSRDQPLRWRELETVRESLQGTSSGVFRGSLHSGKNVRPYCHACLGESLAVHPDGSVYPCAQTAGDRAAASGTVWEPDWSRLRRFYADVSLRGSCAQCQLGGRCPGDCPSRITYNTGQTAGIVCTIYRTIAACLIKKD